MASQTKIIDRQKGIVNDSDRVRIRAAVKGRIQEKMARDLIRTGSFSNPCQNLIGKAWRYSSRYKRSYHNFAERVQDHEVELEYESGAQGGDYSSSYHLKNYEN